MKAGDMVFVRVNGGQLTEAQIIEIHGDIVRVSGRGEMQLAASSGRVPLGVGFPIHSIIIKESAKDALTTG